MFVKVAEPKLTTQGNPSVAMTVFAVATSGLSVGIGGQPKVHGWATGGSSMKGPQTLVTLVETAGKFTSTGMHALIIFNKFWKSGNEQDH